MKRKRGEENEDEEGREENSFSSDNRTYKSCSERHQGLGVEESPSVNRNISDFIDYLQRIAANQQLIIANQKAIKEQQKVISRQNSVTSDKLSNIEKRQVETQAKLTELESEGGGILSLEEYRDLMGESDDSSDDDSASNSPMLGRYDYQGTF